VGRRPRPNQSGEHGIPRTTSPLNLVGFLQVGLITLAALYAIYHAKPVLLPLVLSLLLTMVLKPAQRTLCKFRIPGTVAAAVVVMCLLAALITAASAE
jgi:predicted PurR-regulated permease PerM